MRHLGELHAPVITVELSEAVDRENVGLVTAAIRSALDRTVGHGKHAVEVVARSRLETGAGGGARFRG